MNPLLKLMPAPTGDWVKTKVLEILVASGADPKSIRYDQAEFQLSIGDQQVFLGNLLALCRTLWPWQRRAAIRHFLGMITRPPDRPKTFEGARPHLLPGVRDSFMFEALAVRARLEGHEPVAPSGFALGSRLWMALFVDFPDATSVVTVADLQEWGVSFEQALEPALENLSRRSTGPLVTVVPGLFHSPWHDCYDPARILRRETLSALELQGDPVMLAPNWNHLIVTGSENAERLSAAISFASKVLQQEPRPMSALPLVRRNGEWMDLDLPKSHPVEPLLRKSRVLEMSSVYQEQGYLLEKLHEREARDVYVAKFNGLHDEEKDSYDSYAVWSRGVPTLLPKTEHVFFFDDRRQKVAADVSWPLVQLHCSDLLKDAGLTPRRFLVEEFPSAETLRAMEARSSPYGPSYDPVGVGEESTSRR